MKLDDRLLLCIRRGDNEEAQNLLRDVNPCGMVDDSGTTLLHVAADCGNTDMTKHLIERGCEVDAADDLGNNPLILASRHSHEGVIRLLIEADASVLIVNKQGESAAKISVGGAEHSRVIWDLVLEKVKKECSNDSELIAKKLLEVRCPLPRAVRLKDTAITKYMLDNGCDVNEKDTAGPEFTALHQAVIFEDPENVKLLLDYSADVNAEDWGFRRPLTFARNAKMLYILLDHGAQLIADNGRLVTGHLFQCWGRDTVEMLIARYKPDFSARDADGCSLRHHLARNVNFDPIEILKNSIGDSFYIDERDHFGCTLLKCAVSAYSLETVKWLLRLGADVLVVNNHGYSVLLSVLSPSKSRSDRLAQTRIAVLLLQYGADVQWIGEHDYTLLDVAKLFKAFATVKFVLAHLAAMESPGCEVKDLIRTKIHSHAMFKTYFDFCKRSLEKLKRTVIKRRVTLYEFLTCSEETLVRLARSEEFVARVQAMMYHKRNSKLYYHIILRQRVGKVVQVVNLRKNAFDVLCKIRELQRNRIIMEKIVDYVVCDDLRVFASRPTF